MATVGLLRPWSAKLHLDHLLLRQEATGEKKKGARRILAQSTDF
jgi:hypothetical protein